MPPEYEMEAYHGTETEREGGNIVEEDVGESGGDNLNHIISAMANVSVTSTVKLSRSTASIQQVLQETLKNLRQRTGRNGGEREEQPTPVNLPASRSSSSHLVIPCPPRIQDINIRPRENDLVVESGSIFLRENKVLGAYASSGEYLDTQFRLLLEDFLRPLRSGVKTVRKGQNSRVKISSLFKGCHIHLKGAREMVLRKQSQLMIPIVLNNLMDVDWEESKLFLNGSLLLISPDNFKSVKFAIIKRGPNKNSSNSSFANVRLDVEFCQDGPTWVVDDSCNNFIVMESPAFYEAYRHTLSFLQVMPLDKFPLKSYIVDADTSPILPAILRNGRGMKKLDFQVFVGANHPKRWAKALDFESWPSAEDMGMDSSQFDAFKTSITQELSIIQGPPGTGKTFIGVQTIKFLLTNPWLTQSRPILVVSYTNHALDQTLEKVYKFVTEDICGGDTTDAEHLILRIGGGSKMGSIKPLTMKYKMDEYRRKLALLKAIEWRAELISIFGDSVQIRGLNPGLMNFQKLPPHTLNGLIASAGKVWKKWITVQDAISANPIQWFGLDDVGLPSPSRFGKQLGRSRKRRGKGGKKELSNLFFFKAPNLMAKIMAKHPGFLTANAMGQLDDRLENLILSTNLTGVSEAEYSIRWAFYLYLMRRMAKIADGLKKDLASTLKKLEPIKDYPSFAASKKAALVLGMTTTGAVKYKDKIVNGLRPKIMFVEEAAHVLEAHVVASLTPHCDQMIMIGDHLQLRPMTADYDMSTKYGLDVSLMERLVQNGVSQKRQNWVQLKNQHRMRPEIARMVCPIIYRELWNDPSVEKYHPVKGCEKNIYFVDHQNFESKKKGSASYHNKYEVEFVTNLARYFVIEIGYKPEQVTVIATYLAQKTLIEQKLKKIMESAGKTPVLVSTVDGYQGEENDIVILSLVRSNARDKIGFLATDNRVCVMLSRARHGLFMIGNMSCLNSSSPTWNTIDRTLKQMGCIGRKLPFEKKDTGAGSTSE